MDVKVKNIPGAASYLTDIIIMGADKKGLRKTTDYMLARIVVYGFYFCDEKHDYFVQQMRYLGIIDKDGIRPDSGNIEDITTMPTRRSFYSLVSHYGTLLPDLQCLCTRQNCLLTKNTK